MANNGLTVKDLRAMLKGVPGHHKVVLSGDAEGNSFGFLGGYCKGVCKDNGHEVEIGDDHVTESMKSMGMGEEDVMAGGKKCVTLWSDR